MSPSLSWDLIVRNRGKSGLDDFAGDLDKTKAEAKEAGQGISDAMKAAGVAAGVGLAASFAQNASYEVGNDKLTGQLGLTTAEAEKAGRVAGDVYAGNWGESMAEVNTAIQAVGTNLGDIGTTSEAELGKATTAALALSSTFDEDVTATAQAAGQMVKNGLAKNATEAFDILTTGYQSGANASGDFLDTLNEYGPQFAKLGIEGPQAIGLLNQGLKAGARNTDIIADAFKEFSIRAVDGSELTADGFKAIGLNAKQMGKDIAAGGPTAEKATAKTIAALQKIKDPIKQNGAGVALFGTQWEDLGPKAFAALDPMSAKATEVKGATDEMAAAVGDNAAGKIESMSRSVQNWVASMGESNSALGMAVVATGQFGGAALEAAGSAGMVATAMRGSAVATRGAAAASAVLSGGLKVLRFAWIAATGPIGLIVIGLAAAAAGLIYAYKHSERFRTIVNAVFKATARVVLGFVDVWLNAFQKMFEVAGKLPGKAGAPFRAAAREVQKMRDKVNGLRNDIGRVKSKHVTITVDVEQRTHISQGISDRLSGGGNSAGSGGSRAGGGPVVAGMEYRVNEQGQEFFTPDRAGSVISSASTRRLSAGADSPGLTIVVNVGSTMASKREIREAVTEAFHAAPAGAKPLPARAVAGAR